ncbi:MAG: tRNA (adenosine(37)-N6)-threonylcarbamoyltransferase complex ATPase subunit type 1 TsaE [Candidatus Moranbacteria bacterium]|nr:tRNA (adenosine(37)-N6)-threonylcarbamoyltransferase complex ATPase subunit type 1 TsaE [Candidatus Moranbacteria bacterium]
MENLQTTYNNDETKDFGRKLAKTLHPSIALCLSGDLGAGKTTLSQGILEGLGALPPYTSPTFVIMKEYVLREATETGIKRIYHVDAYRIESKDIEHLGFEEWCSDPSGLVILEWPERIAELLPQKRIDITLTQKGEMEREIVVTKK